LTFLCKFRNQKTHFSKFGTCLTQCDEKPVSSRQYQGVLAKREESRNRSSSSNAGNCLFTSQPAMLSRRDDCAACRRKIEHRAQRTARAAAELTKRRHQAPSCNQEAARSYGWKLDKKSMKSLKRRLQPAQPSAAGQRACCTGGLRGSLSGAVRQEAGCGKGGAPTQLAVPLAAQPPGRLGASAS
jgi:hypothetical protein